MALSVLKNRPSCIKTLAGHRRPRHADICAELREAAEAIFPKFGEFLLSPLHGTKTVAPFFFMTSKAKLCKMGFAHCKRETWHQPPVDYLLEHVVNLCEVEEVFPYFFNLFGGQDLDGQDDHTRRRGLDDQLQK